MTDAFPQWVQKFAEDYLVSNSPVEGDEFSVRKGILLNDVHPLAFSYSTYPPHDDQQDVVMVRYPHVLSPTEMYSVRNVRLCEWLVEHAETYKFELVQCPYNTEFFYKARVDWVIREALAYHRELLYKLRMMEEIALPLTMKPKRLALMDRVSKEISILERTLREYPSRR